MPVERKVSGARIREARKKSKMSQTQLAYAIKTGEQNIRRWEQGKNTPRVDALARIAEVTGYDISFFLEVESRETEAAPSGGSFRGANGGSASGARDGGGHRQKDGDQ